MAYNDGATRLAITENAAYVNNFTKIPFAKRHTCFDIRVFDYEEDMQDLESLMAIVAAIFLVL